MPTIEKTSKPNDANGNMVLRGDQTISWNADNMPAAIAGFDDLTTFVYDGDGGRVVKNENGETTVYVNLYFELNLTTGNATAYYYLGSRLVALRAGANLRFVHQDHLTGTSLTTDSSGDLVARVKYCPYGETRSSSGALGTDRMFTGQRLDGTGLYFYNARYYDPLLGRFISPDALVAHPIDTQSLNRYSYCRNNPLRWIDPSGYQDGRWSDYQTDKGCEGGECHFKGGFYEEGEHGIDASAFAVDASVSIDPQRGVAPLPPRISAHAEAHIAEIVSEDGDWRLTTVSGGAHFEPENLDVSIGGSLVEFQWGPLEVRLGVIVGKKGNKLQAGAVGLDYGWIWNWLQQSRNSENAAKTHAYMRSIEYASDETTPLQSFEHEYAQISLVTYVPYHGTIYIDPWAIPRGQVGVVASSVGEAGLIGLGILPTPEPTASPWDSL